MKSTWCVAIVIAILVSFLPASLEAQPTINPPPPGQLEVVNNGPGDHFDPHISGNLVSYTDAQCCAGSFSVFSIRYHDFSTSPPSDNGVPTVSGTMDFLSDVSGNTIAFGRVLSDTKSAIFTYTIGIGAASAVEVAPPVPVFVFRQAPQIGMNTIAWQEFSTSIAGVFGSNIVAYDRATGVTTPVTSDSGVLNETPALSPDGNVVVWAKCATFTACDIWSAIRSGTPPTPPVWTAHQLTTGGGCPLPVGTGGPRLDTNGQVAVYSCNRSGKDSLHWQPVAGGAEQTLDMLGSQVFPSIAGQFVAFASEAPGAFRHNIFILDISTLTLYQITNTAAFTLGCGSCPNIDNQLTDISLTPDGKVRVVWQTLTSGVFSVWAYTFSIPTVVPFASFAAKVDINVASSSFDTTGTFTLGPGGSINPLAQDVTIQVGGFTATISAGKFMQNNQGFVFAGISNGAALQMIISPQTSTSFAFSFQAAGTVPAIANPVTVGLTIGNNAGGVMVNADFL